VLVHVVGVRNAHTSSAGRPERKRWFKKSRAREVVV